MGKGRLTAAEVAAQVAAAQRLVGTTCINVYDLSQRTLQLKLSAPPSSSNSSSSSSGSSGGGPATASSTSSDSSSKPSPAAAPSSSVLLVLEAGIRVHSTQFERARPPFPSPLTVKVRKHVRRRRVVAIQQLGLDRAICISFSGADGGAHIICEMYAAGNLILASADYTILALQRPFRDDARGLVFLPQHPYPLHCLRSKPQLSESLDVLSSENNKDKSLRDNLLATPLGSALGNAIVADLVSRF